MDLFSVLFAIFMGVPLLVMSVYLMRDAIRERCYLEFFASLVPLFFGVAFVGLFVASLIALIIY